MSYTLPTAEEQLVFLQQIQRLLREGSFVSTYKFALLHSLADLSVLKGDDPGAPLTLTMEELAERFFVLYERQALPFPGARVQILQQNTGRQAAIVSRIAEATGSYLGRRADPKWERRLLSNIDATIRKMPLWKLQRVGNETLNFLYDNTEEYRVTHITLKPGVAYCFRTFYSFITSLVQNAWISYVRRYNTDIIGEHADLQDFLFGARRASLVPLRETLYELQNGRCFYTGRALPPDAEVDHFIPWSRYPLDLGHNFVLACGQANRSKSDHIASEEHLEHWTRFCLKNHPILIERFEDLGIQHNLRNSFQVAHWCYTGVQQAQAQVWIGGTSLRKLSGRWQDVLDGALGEVPGPA